MDDGPEAIQDEAELMRVRVQARQVHIKALLVAAMLTTLTLLLP